MSPLVDKGSYLLWSKHDPEENLLEAVYREFNPSTSMVLRPPEIELKYPPVPKTNSNGEPFDDPSEAWIFPNFPPDTNQATPVKITKSDAAEQSKE